MYGCMTCVVCGGRVVCGVGMISNLAGPESMNNVMVPNIGTSHAIPTTKPIPSTHSGRQKKFCGTAASHACMNPICARDRPSCLQQNYSCPRVVPRGALDSSSFICRSGCCFRQRKSTRATGTYRCHVIHSQSPHTQLNKECRHSTKSDYA
jgi:hypothetical protein